jgi:hypothetical protein
MITFQVEDWIQVYPEIATLQFAHWEEVGTHRDEIPLALDHSQINHIYSLGQMHVVTVRMDGRLVGYHVSFVRPHLHYRESLSSYTDVYFIRKDVRNFRVAVGLFKEVERTLAQRGVQRMFTGTKRSLNAGGLFKMLGWTHVEDLYVKIIR